jgi:hypothetical protein
MKHPLSLTAVIAGILAVGLTVAISTPAAAAAATISVPNDFVPGLSDTRSAGHYEVVNSALHIYTDNVIDTTTQKVAEYVAASVPLASVGEPSLEYSGVFGIDPGFQLVVDFDGNGTHDGILVGETAYGNDWWASNGSAPFVKDGAPVVGSGSGSLWHGTLAEWRANFPNAIVTAFGFSLGSGAYADGTLNALQFNGDRYTFAKTVVLASKLECKDGGWTTSTAPVFRNQGDCTRFFASGR